MILDLAQLVPDVIGGAGVLVAGWAAWKATRATERANAIADRALAVDQTLADIEARALDASQAVAAIEDGRRRVERTPRLSATLTTWGEGQSGYLLAVWLGEVRNDGGGDCRAGHDLMARCHGVRMARVSSKIRGACPGTVGWSHSGLR